MIAILRLVVVALVVLTLVYFVTAAYLRSTHREKLEKQWDADPPEGQGETERRVFIDAGMKSYERGLGMKLLWLVYILPLIAFGLIIYYIN